jgi:hypothetical protein
MARAPNALHAQSAECKKQAHQRRADRACMEAYSARSARTSASMACDSAVALWLVAKPKQFARPALHRPLPAGDCERREQYHILVESSGDQHTVPRLLRTGRGGAQASRATEHVADANPSLRLNLSLPLDMFGFHATSEAAERSESKPAATDSALCNHQISAAQQPADRL